MRVWSGETRLVLPADHHRDRAAVRLVRGECHLHISAGQVLAWRGLGLFPPFARLSGYLAFYRHVRRTSRLRASPAAVDAAGAKPAPLPFVCMFVGRLR